MNTLPLQKITGLCPYKSKEIPKYLYTITTKKSYDSMCKDGFIKVKQDPIRQKLSGIFLFDIINFTKRWSRTLFRQRNDYATELLASIGYRSGELVVLKIPTKTLDGTLKIRDLTYLFKHCNKMAFDEHLDVGLDAKLRKRLNQHKKPIEYIFKNNIPIENTEKIGEISIEDKVSLMRGQLNLKDILLKLFENTPQHKAVEQMK